MVNGQEAYILQRYCIKHFNLENYPHKDDVSIEFNWSMQTPDYSHLFQNDTTQKETDVYQQGCSSSQLIGEETPVSSG